MCTASVSRMPCPYQKRSLDATEGNTSRSGDGSQANSYARGYPQKSFDMDVNAKQNIFLTRIKLVWIVIATLSIPALLVIEFIFVIFSFIGRNQESFTISGSGLFCSRRVDPANPKSTANFAPNTRSFALPGATKPPHTRARWTIYLELPAFGCLAVQGYDRGNIFHVSLCQLAAS